MMMNRRILKQIVFQIVSHVFIWGRERNSSRNIEKETKFEIVKSFFSWFVLSILKFAEDSS